LRNELNQPLTAVMTHAYACREWLRSKPANLEKASATAEKIVSGEYAGQCCCPRVRALFHKDAEVREQTSINRLIQEPGAPVARRGDPSRFRIRLELARDLPHLAMDPVQIQQVLLNLAINGMDAMTPEVPARANL